MQLTTNITSLELLDFQEVSSDRICMTAWSAQSKINFLSKL